MTSMANYNVFLDNKALITINLAKPHASNVDMDNIKMKKVKLTVSSVSRIHIKMI